MKNSLDPTHLDIHQPPTTQRFCRFLQRCRPHAPIIPRSKSFVQKNVRQSTSSCYLSSSKESSLRKHPVKKGLLNNSHRVMLHSFSLSRSRFPLANLFCGKENSRREQWAIILRGRSAIPFLKIHQRCRNLPFKLSNYSRNCEVVSESLGLIQYLR